MTAKMQTAREIVAEKSKLDVEWRPASTLDVTEGMDTENFRYKWVSKVPSRVKRHQAEGWSFVNEADGDHVFHRRAQTGSIDAGRALTSEVEFKEVVLMKLPKARAESRDRYYQAEAEKALGVINRDVAQQARSMGGEVTPRTQVQSGNSVTVIE